MWQIIKKICCAVCHSDDLILSPTSFEEITIDELRSLLQDKFPEADIYLSDKIYKLCSLSDITSFLKQDQTNRYEFVSESMDCDDFAYRLMGQCSIPEWSALAFGICWTDKHALNCLVDSKKKFYFIEPQKDTIQETLKAWQGSMVRLVIM